MALVSCPHCGKEVSDKARVCPGCGEELLRPEAEPVEKTIVCDDCGTEYSEALELCPNCGCPKPQAAVEENPQNVKVTGVSVTAQTKKKIKIIAIAVAAVIVAVIAAVIMITVSNQKKQEEQKAAYRENLESTAYLMLDGAAKAESAGNLIKSVWSDAIYEEWNTDTYKYVHPNYSYVDFNTALANLFADEDFQKTQREIKSNQDQVARRMKELNNPPEEYKDAHSAMDSYYDAYLELTELATSPTGSLQTYSQNFNEADTEALNAYKKMKRYFD